MSKSPPFLLKIDLFPKNDRHCLTQRQPVDIIAKTNGYRVSLAKSLIFFKFTPLLRDRNLNITCCKRRAQNAYFRLFYYSQLFQLVIRDTSRHPKRTYVI